MGSYVLVRDVTDPFLASSLAEAINNRFDIHGCASNQEGVPDDGFLPGSTLYVRKGYEEQFGVADVFEADELLNNFIEIFCLGFHAGRVSGAVTGDG